MLNFAGGSGVDTFTVTASNTNNLSGQGGGDIFNFNGGTLTGTVQGDAGNDTFTLNGGSVTGTVAGNTGADTLTGGTDYVVTGADDSGTVTGISGGWNGIENLTGTAGADTFTFTGGNKLSGTANGLGGTDTLDFSSAVTQSITLTGPGPIDGFAGDSTSINGFTNIDDVLGSAGADTLTGNIAAGGTFTVQPGSDTYVSTNTLTFNGIENLTGGSGPDTYAINEAYTGNLNGAGGDNTYTVSSPLTGNITSGTGADTLTATAQINGNITDTGGDNVYTLSAVNGSVATGGGNDNITLNATVSGGVSSSGGNNTVNLNASISNNITTGAGNDIFNFNAGTDSGNLSAGLGNNVYNFNGGSATGTVNVTGDDTWNHATGISLGSAVIGNGTLTVPNAAGGDLAIGPTDLLLPDMTGFTGHLIAGGTITTPTLPLDGSKTVVVNTDILTVNSAIVLGTGGSVTLLGSNLDLNADITAGASGVTGGQINLIAVGDANGGSGPGNITAVANPTSIKGSSMIMIAQGDIVNPANLEIELGGGSLQIALGSGNTPQFGFLDASQNLAGTLETNAFLGVLGLSNAKFVQGQILVLGNLIGLEQIAFLDVGLFEQDLSLFGVIGQGVALALAQCEELEGCAPNVTDAELKELIVQLDARVKEIRRRLGKAPEKAKPRLQKLLDGYQDQLDSFKQYKVELEAYTTGGGELGPGDQGDAFTAKSSARKFAPEDTVASEIRRLSSIIDMARKRIEWLQGLKKDRAALIKLLKSAGLKIKRESLDRIIDATQQEILNLQQQIQSLLSGDQAQVGGPFFAEAAGYANRPLTGYGDPLYLIDNKTYLARGGWF